MVIRTSFKESGFHDRIKIYDELEAALSPYLAGDECTAADLYLFMLLNWDRDLKNVLDNASQAESAL